MILYSLFPLPLWDETWVSKRKRKWQRGNHVGLGWPCGGHLDRDTVTGENKLALFKPLRLFHLFVTVVRMTLMNTSELSECLLCARYTHMYTSSVLTKLHNINTFTGMKNLMTYENAPLLCLALSYNHFTSLSLSQYSLGILHSKIIS